MKFEKKNWILLGLVAMLCFTGFLNYKFNTTVSDSPQVAMQAPSNTAEQSANADATPEADAANANATPEADAANANAAAMTYYTDFRKERKSNREQQIAWLDGIIQDKKSDAADIKEANEKKLALIHTMETEANTEGLIKAKGYSECIVTIQDEACNVVVENTEALTSAQAAQIMDIVREQTGVKSENIKIMPRK